MPSPSESFKSRRAEVLAQVTKHGWDAGRQEDYALEWWADEMWLLESKWSPVGARAYLTFLVDPQAPDAKNRKRGRDVWAVKLSADRPVDWLSAEGEFTLDFGRGWREQQMPAFLEYLSGLRRAASK